jgi:hypothetical protein
MMGRTQNHSAGQQPPLRPISSAQDAATNAATWMRHWGYPDAAVTNGRVGVRSTRARGQVTYLAAAVDRPELQRLAASGAGDPAEQLFVFSGSGYTATALEYAGLTGMALFDHGLDGAMTPVSAVARDVMQGTGVRMAAATAAVGPVALPPSGWKERWKDGGWYLGVPILSAGVFAAVPFWHAHSRLHRPELRSLAVKYTVAGIAIMAVAGITPKDAQGDPVGVLGAILSTGSVVAALIVMVAACVKLSRFRREIFSRPGWGAPEVDPHVDQAQRLRARREEARTLKAQDRERADELGIGRPDLGQAYDDGGLVDLNTAPAAVIASVCGMDESLAEAIVAARTRRGGDFYVLGEVLMDVALPPSARDELRDRAVL